MNDDEEIPNYQRQVEIFNFITELASGNLEARRIPSGKRDELDGIVVGLNMLAEELSSRVVLLSEIDKRINDISEVIVSFASLDFTKKASFGTQGNALDAMASGLNALGEELEIRIEEMKDMQAKLAQADRLTVLGQLGAGISHELRNPLGAIRNCAYFLGMALEDQSPEIKEALEIIESSLGVCDNIISSLLEFAHPKRPISEKVAINEILENVLHQVGASENVEVVLQMNQELPFLISDRGQLSLIFMNIILNAVQAMPEGGQLIIRTEISDSRWVDVSFIDSGVGIADDILGDIFNPFFSTKAKGIGLGLAITKILVEANNGTIEVQSKEGKGSRFTVRMPIRPPE